MYIRNILLTCSMRIVRSIVEVFGVTVTCSIFLQLGGISSFLLEPLGRTYMPAMGVVFILGDKGPLVALYKMFTALTGIYSPYFIIPYYIWWATSLVYRKGVWESYEVIHNWGLVVTSVYSDKIEPHQWVTYHKLCFISNACGGIPHLIGFWKNGCTMPEYYSGIRIKYVWPPKVHE